jgi:Uma2 family endonuclease
VWDDCRPHGDRSFAAEETAMASKVATPPLIPGTRVPMTYEEYWALGDLEGIRVEWVDGEAIVYMGALTRHVEMSDFTFNLLSGFVRIHDLGSVFHEKLAMDVPTRPSVREPDIIVLLKDHRHLVAHEGLMGSADQVWEFTSEDSVTIDRRDKFQEYARAGIPEYVMADSRPGKHRFDYYRLNADIDYDKVLPDGQGRYHSLVLPGFWFDPRWLWQEPLPDVDELLVRIAGMAYINRILAIQRTIQAESDADDAPPES